jgi:hypothetical protein
VTDDNTLTVPRMIKVQQKLDSLHIALPRRHGSGSKLRGQTLLLVGAVMLTTSCAGFFSTLVISLLQEIEPVLAVIALPVLLLLSLAPYVVIFLAIRRASARGSVVLTQRMLKMEGRGALELPLEEVHGIEMITDGDRGSLRFDTARGEITLFDGLFLHELEWLHHTIDAHTQRLREMMQGDGYDTAVAARPPEAITRLLHE